MQIDMHYYGTYAMARAAGMVPDAARIIATAAEFVDDSDEVHIPLSDGCLLSANATAHHPANLANIDLIDQREIWLPFHFIPGDQGDSFEERLLCCTDSAIAQEMVQRNIQNPREAPPLELIGITAHVYADTFSHYGFSGITSKFNRINRGSIRLDVKNTSVLDYMTDKWEAFDNKYVRGAAANAAGLGHGSASTFPDRPFLTWRFDYEDPKRPSGERVNQNTFLAACRKLHQMFTAFGEKNSDMWDKGQHRAFRDIENTVSRILAIESKLDGRIAAWQTAAADGAFYSNPQRARIPTYNEATFGEEIMRMTEHSSGSVTGTNGYGFLAAAGDHRRYVLSDLLPKHDLFVLNTI